MKPVSSALHVLCALCVFSCLASGQEEIRTTVVEVVGDRAAVDMGAKSGIKEGAVFRLYSPSRIIRIPLTDIVTYQSGEPVATLVADDVRAEKAWGDVNLFGEGVELCPGMDAVFIGQRNLKLSGSLSVEAESDSAGPGDWIAVRVKGAPENSVYHWRASAGWLSASQGLKSTVYWVAPAKPGPAEISIRAVSPTDDEYKASLTLAVQEVPFKPAAELQQHLVAGRMLSSGGEPRVSDVAVTADGFFYTDIRMGGIYRLAGVAGVSEVAGPNRGKKLFGPFALAVSAGKAYVLDDDFYKLKRYDIATGKAEAILDKNVAMSQPVDLAVAANGLIYVVDRSARKIHVIETSGTFRLSFGKKGTAAGEFSNPVAIDLDEQANILVLDARRKVVIVYDPAMGLKEEWKLDLMSGNAPLDFAAGPRGDIYVLEGPRTRIVKYHSGGRPLLRSGEGIFPNLPAEAARVATDPAGNLYVTPGNRAGIFRYSPDGAFMGGAALSGVRTPVGMAVAQNGFAALHFADPPFVEIMNAEGWSIQNWGEPFDKPTRFNLPGRLAFRPDSRALYALGASDIGAFAVAKRTFTVYLFSLEGKLLEYFGGAGEAYGRFLTMNDCDIDATGGLWVLDNKAMRVTGFFKDRNMPFVRNLVRGRSERHELSEPGLLAVAPDAQSFYIYDRRLRSIKRFDREGAIINLLDLARLRPSPEDIPRIITGPFGYLYILDRGRAAVHVASFADKPEVIGVVTVKRPDGKLVDMGIDAAGRLLVVSDKATVYALGKR
ncbi:MAG: 6-bladed beta-propeller [Planctomycetes bacterium]|nr:6-bladed beta-propeller [Planctomycetota bacterium]